MIFWIDAQLPPQLAQWLSSDFGVEAFSVRDLGLRDAQDLEIFKIAQTKSKVTIITKDSDFVELVMRFGIPPQILWVTCGNVTNRHLKKLFAQTFPQAVELLEKGEHIVEITDRTS